MAPRLYAPNDEFTAYYREFIQEVVEPFVGCPVVFQRVPTFRVQLPDNLAVGEFHRDADYGHQAASINFWVPLTAAKGSSAVYFHYPNTGKNEAAPDLDMGHVLVFDGVHIRHGNFPNKTDRTRVSFDFRVIRAHEFVPAPDAATINTAMPFDLSPVGYYSRLDAVTP